MALSHDDLWPRAGGWPDADSAPAWDAGAGVPPSLSTSPHPDKTGMIVLERDLSGPAAAGRAVRRERFPAHG